MTDGSSEETRTMDELLARVRNAQDAVLEDESVRDAVVQRVAEHMRVSRPARPVRRSWTVAAAAVAALGVGGAAWAMTRGPVARAPLSFHVRGGVTSVGGFVAALDPAEVLFSDGSLVRADHGARMRIVATSADGAQAVIEQGTIEARVVHDDSTDWRFLAGPFAIVVTGTRFVASWSPAAAELVVSVKEGAVRVQGACLDRSRSVRAGETFRTACEGWGAPSARLAVHPVAVRPVVSAGASEPSVPSIGRPRVAMHRHVVGSQAYAPEPAERDADLVPPAREALAEVRIESATRAALAGDVGGAERMLREIRALRPGSDDAALAAFLLGRLAFDEQGDYDAAARWFASYVAERPEGTLVREAMGREFEARDRADDPIGARAAAQRYLRRFPDGPHAVRARALAEHATTSE